ncbi:hypothetical protein Tfer_2932 [Thermincola ferriacetica]|uniref:Uncharacterized protein n=2 Tax=Thermincola TaxID=278993 RepID=D5XD88_THEPJ|nr:MULTISPECIES: hypothetical protein [Thermincola]ADG81736.1 hypothetical protein TherJR_0869 [Thermincola potens JR]KNZ68537.1 hypothetical protein Tfer_2932 [Thermincola ferriacetica]
MEIIYKVKYDPKTKLPRIRCYGYIYSANGAKIPVILPKRPV